MPLGGWGEGKRKRVGDDGRGKEQESSLFPWFTRVIILMPFLRFTMMMQKEVKCIAKPLIRNENSNKNRSTYFLLLFYIFTFLINTS